jgi:hypothetical protein
MLRFKQYLDLQEAEKVPANRGDVGEFVLGAAVTTRFWKKYKGNDVTENDVKDILRKVIKTNPVSLKREDEDVVEIDTQISDDIRFKVSVPKKAQEFMYDSKNWLLIPDLFKASIEYVNTDKRMLKQASILARNNKRNDIFINADGTGEQKATKADIKLVIDDKPTRNQISLKVDGGDQFMQIAGYTFEKQMTLWNHLGVNIDSYKADYENSLSKLDLKVKFADRASVHNDINTNLFRDAVEKVYKSAASILKKELNDANPDIILKIASFVRRGATLDDPNVEVVKLNRGKLLKAKFGKKYLEAAKQTTFDVDFVKRKKDFLVVIYDKKLGKSKGKFLSIRAKIDPAKRVTLQGKSYHFYFRNIVESGKLFFALGSLDK